MRSVVSILVAVVVWIVTFVVVPLLLSVVSGALLLGAGTLLTRVFSVTVFEATLILTLVAIPIMALALRLLGYLNVAVKSAEELEEEEGPSAVDGRWIQVPRGTAHRGR